VYLSADGESHSCFGVSLVSLVNRLRALLPRPQAVLRHDLLTTRPPHDTTISVYSGLVTLAPGLLQ
jgi:hypothetical protein